MLELTIICVVLALLLAYQERVHHIERQELYRRIQSPEVVAAEELPTVAFVPPEDDAAFWQAAQEREDALGAER